MLQTHQCWLKDHFHDVIKDNFIMRWNTLDEGDCKNKTALSLKNISLPSMSLLSQPHQE